MGFKLIIPSAVGKEVEAYQEEGLAISKYKSTIPLERDWFTLRTRYTYLGEGEMEVIAHGLYLKETGESYVYWMIKKSTA